MRCRVGRARLAVVVPKAVVLPRAPPLRRAGSRCRGRPRKVVVNPILTRLRSVIRGDTLKVLEASMRTCCRAVLPVLVLTAFLTAVAGSAFAAEAPFVPFDLGTLGGNASAHAVNNSGRVVGVVAGARFRAFSWTSAEGMIDLGTLGCSGESEATAVNASGQVVGPATT